MKTLYTILILFSCFVASAQVDTSKATLSYSGFAELYYAYDFNQPDNHVRPSFFYSHNRHNEFTLNLGFMKAAYNSEKVRANIALAIGTYMNANYSAEPGVLKNIFEANGGVKLSNKKNLWLDAGIFASHIGFESAISKDCWALTRSILGENCPYYESGVRLSYTSDNSKWFLCGLILNGWQHIQRPDWNNTPAFGSQITFTPNSNVTLNYSTFVGNEKPDSAKQMRYFHNFYGVFHFSDKLHLTTGFDYGMEQSSTESKNYNSWYSPVVLLKYVISDQWAIVGRAEFYSDKKGVIIASGTANGFQTSGYSLNLDCKIRENALWRVEARTLNSKDKVFYKEGGMVNTNTFVTTSLAISF